MALGNGLLNRPLNGNLRRQEPPNVLRKRDPVPVSQVDLYENNPSGNLLKGMDLQDFLPRLQQTVIADMTAMDVFRENRLAIIQQHAGCYYGPGGTDYEVPLPLISTYLEIHSRALIPKEPRVFLSTFDEAMDPAVDAMMNWENDFFEEIELGETLRRVVFDALISEGRVKVCLTMPETAVSGYDMEVGQPYIYHIDDDDWIEDMRAKSSKDRTYYGHKYRVPLEVARDIFDKKIHASDPSDSIRGIDKVFTVGAGNTHRDEIEDYVDLWEIHYIRKGLIFTLLDDGGLPGDSKKHLLRVRKYIGPKSGNCLSLAYGIVPGNIRGHSPCMKLLPLHLAANRSYRKLIDTADNYKEVLAVRGGAMSGDGKAIKEAKHMEIINSDNPQDARPLKFNAPPPELGLFVQDLRSAFDFMGGGLATLGGRNQMANTATQEKILNANAGSGLQDMQSTTTTFIARSVRIMNWYLWYHPTNQYPSKKKIPGLEETFSRVLYPYNDQLPSHKILLEAHELMRKGPMPRIKVDPYSLSHMTPGEKNQFVTMILAEMAPYAALLAEQGVYVNWSEVLKLKAILGDEPLVNKMFKFQGNPQQMVEGQPDEGGQEGPGLNKDISVKPAQTERTYNRISSGGAGQQKADMQNQWMSLAAKPQQ